MKSFNFRTKAYCNCEAVYEKLISQGIEELSQKNLRKLISKYIVGSSKMIKEYEKRFVDFEFLIPQRLGKYKVNQEIFFSSNRKQEAEMLYQNTIKEDPDQYNPDVKIAKSMFLNKKMDDLNHQSKTLVYPEDLGARVPYSVKVKKGLKDRYVGKVKGLGLDCCYVQEAWMNAFMVATDEANNLIHVPLQIGFSVLNVNLIVPYVVSKPRRKRKHIEVFDEEETW